VGDIVDGVGIIDLNVRDCRSNGTDNRVQLLHSPRAIMGKFEAAERCVRDRVDGGKQGDVD
jgi:hypothetical protein